MNMNIITMHKQLLGVTSNVEFRKLDHERMDEFAFGADKRRKLILMFPQDDRQPPPPVEGPSEKDMLKVKKARKGGSYREDNVVQDWTEKLLVKHTGDSY